MITVSYTLQELQDLTALLDVAVRNQGLKAAGPAFLLHQKHAASLDMAKDVKDKIDSAVSNVVELKPQE